FHELQERHLTSEADRAARLVIIEEQGRRLAQVDGERQHAHGQIAELRRQVETAETARAKQELRVAEEADAHRDLQERLSQLQTSFQAVTSGHHALRAQLAHLLQLQKSFENVTAERQALQEQLDKEGD